MTTSVVKKKTSGCVWVFLALVVVITLGDFAGLLLPAWQAHQAAKTAVDFSGATMGTSYSIKAWWGIDKVSKSEIDNLLKEINQQMSTYLPDSELSKFNVASSNEWFAVSKQTAFVVQRALYYHKITDGASDVTVGPLVRLWDFGPGRHSIGAKLESPTDVALEKTMKYAGGEKLEVRLEPPALRKTISELEVDLSSIAKGYAVDAVIELLINRGYENFMVEIGGEVRAGGTRRDGEPWRIGVEFPDVRQRAIHRVISLKDQALATSGDYRNFREFDGQKVSHIIDPQTGRPLAYRGWSVTLLAPTCLEADALATALLVMGEDRGYDWCKKHEVAALFLIRKDDEVIEKQTPQFTQLWLVRKKMSQCRERLSDAVCHESPLFKGSPLHVVF